jgi:hypothetical protein
MNTHFLVALSHVRNQIFCATMIEEHNDNTASKQRLQLGVYTVSSNQPPTTTSTYDDIYVKIMQAEQEHTRTRWTVATFFMSVSFAIFGLSFQSQLTAPKPIVMRVSALLIYWFAYFLFLRFRPYSGFLSKTLEEMEKSKRTSVTIQTKEADRTAKDAIYRLFTSTLLLFLFGLIYTAGVILLGIFGQ